ncbi:hypothetical protein JQ621_17930 [Bradyrhizobium manausense]|uniref:hypothetical protein n=1 Tax=Bradyrhizobium manausense TaxID=989370 RepID=UPI001BACD2C9|nr:hypothetical protein [Bradyrhizobium manausense]MBR1089348.1 hypothetical protein [Bradyrhizobium manausense]
MDPVYRVVTQLPLTELWRGEGALDVRRAEDVSEVDIKLLLRNGSTFVVADVGKPLMWIPEVDRFAFWKAEVKDRLVSSGTRSFRLDDYVGGYCYTATVWRSTSAAPVIVLEMHH